MNCVDVKPGMKQVALSGEVTAVSPTRDVQTRRGPGQVATATIQDASGRIELSLWNENITKVHVGSKVSIENAMASSYKGKTQLSLGLYGKLNVA